jgi:hypothetical protein
MESWDIVNELEKQYPTPSLHLDDPIVEKVLNINLFKYLVPNIMPKIPKLLSKVSAEYFSTTREEQFGKSLQQMEAEAKDEAWDQTKPIAKEVGDLLREKEGPFFLGEKSKSSKSAKAVEYGWANGIYSLVCGRYFGDDFKVHRDCGREQFPEVFGA